MAKGKAKKAVKKGGGKRKAKAPTKEETVEVNNSMSLLLGNMPPVRDIIYHLETIKGLQDRARTAAGKVTDAKKKAKEAGIDMGALSLAMGYERMDPLEMATQLRQMQAVMREKGMPVQLALYEPKFGTIEAQATHEGWAAGIAGRSPDMERWPEGSPGSKEMMRAWNDGQADVIANPKKYQKSDDDE